MESTPELTSNTENMETALESARRIDWGASMSYFTELFSGNPSPEDVRALSAHLAEMYPADREALTALAELPGFFAIEREMQESQMLEKMGVLNAERRKEEQQKRRKLVQELTQYQFLLTHLIVDERDNEEYLANFWNGAKQLAQQDHSLGEMDKVRDSVPSQAAIYQLFETLGKNPRLSHPKEDAFYAVDLWTEDHQAIQVKGAPKSETSEVVPTNNEPVAFPGVALDDGEKIRHYNSYITHERQYMRAKLSQLERIEGKGIDGYLVVIPRNMRNPTTGKPDERIVEEARKTLT